MIDVDWIASDLAGGVAMFLGETTASLPRAADPRMAPRVLEAVARALPRIRAEAVVSSYREGVPVRDAVFDPPRSAPGVPIHEAPFLGYSHVIIAHPDHLDRVRSAMRAPGGREMPGRGAVAFAFDRLAPAEYDALHAAGACDGCRAEDDPRDPRARSARTLAAAGLYVYAFVAGAVAGAPPSGVWARVASPARSPSRVELQELDLEGVALPDLEIVFEETPFIPATAPVLARGAARQRVLRL